MARRRTRRNKKRSRRQRGGCGCDGSMKGGSKLSVGPLNMQVMPPPRSTHDDIPRPAAKKGGRRRPTRRTRRKRKRRSMCARLTNKACKSKRYKKRCKTTRRKKRGSKGRKSHCRTRKNRYAKRPNRKRRRKQKGGGLLRDIGLGDALQGYYSGVDMVDNARNRWAGRKAVPSSDPIRQPKMMQTPEAQYKIPNVPDYYNRASVRAAKHHLIK
tara:strand:+ start:652 stop:1290 length:639 start_codon:yes stop_codon:yes gene_type:complete